MSKKEDGGPAFPGQPSYGMPGGVEVVYGQQGMTLKDWYAGKALQGLLASEPILRALAGPGGADGADTVARVAGMLADAMLKEREK